MKTADITDLMVVQAAQKRAETDRMITDILVEMTGAPEKVVYSAMERAYRHKLIECGVSLRTSWLTDKGRELLSKGASA